MALKVHGSSVITYVTSQNSCGVENIETLNPNVISSQLNAIFVDLSVKVIKTAILVNHKIIEVTASYL